MRNLLLTASAIASIALPTLGLAQGNDDRMRRDQPAARQDMRQDARTDDRRDARPDDRRPGFDQGRPGYDHARAWNPGDRTW